jgi:hypothetical protein
MIRHEEVRQLLDYDSGSGVFRWKKRIGSEVIGGMREALVGEEAGRVHGSGYREIEVRGERYKASRLAWFWVHGEWPAGQIDHINHELGDDRIENLRRRRTRRTVGTGGQ